MAGMLSRSELDTQAKAVARLHDRFAALSDVFQMQELLRLEVDGRAQFERALEMLETYAANVEAALGA